MHLKKTRGVMQHRTGSGQLTVLCLQLLIGAAPDVPHKRYNMREFSLTFCCVPGNKKVYEQVGFGSEISNEQFSSKHEAVAE